MSDKPNILPDGSSFFTSNVMSKDEAMKLPLKDRPICFRISSEIYHAIFEAVGAASLCWNPKPGNNVFDSTAAEKIAVDLCFKVANELEGEFENKILTCVYCGMQYPDGTPPHGSKILTDHIKVCEKHPMRSIRKALCDLVGASTVEDLQQMQRALQIMPNDENKLVAEKAVKVLLETA